MNDFFPLYNIGHFINQPNNPTEFEILEFSEIEEPNVDDFHKHTFYEIIWIEAGTSKQVIDYNEYSIKPYTLFFLSPNQVHYFAEWHDIIGGTILFTEDFYLLNKVNKNALFEMTYLDNLYIKPYVEFSKEEFTEIMYIIKQIKNEHHHSEKNISIIQAYLHILLSKVQRQINFSELNDFTKKHIVIFKKFKKLLECYFTENKTAQFYADKLCIIPFRYDK